MERFRNLPVNFGEKGEMLRVYTKENKKKFKLPKKILGKARKANKDYKSVLVEFITLKGTVEWMILPSREDHIIIYDKVYWFDPQTIQNMKVGFNKTYKVLIIKEGDMCPVSNLDYDELISMGRSTNNHKLLIKAALEATLAQAKPKVSKGMIVFIVILIIAGIAGYMLFAG